MKQPITNNTTLWLGPRGEISLIRHDHKTAFTIQELMNDRTVVAEDGEDNCIIYRIMRAKLNVLLRSGKNICHEARELADFLNLAGLAFGSEAQARRELAGVNDEPYAEYSLTGPAPEHLPVSGRLVPVTETTPLYLTPMGTISLSPAKDHPKKRYGRFTVARLRNRWDDARSFDQRMFSDICDLGGFVGRLTMCKMDDDCPPWAETSGLITYGTLLKQNGLRLVERTPSDPVAP